MMRRKLFAYTIMFTAGIASGFFSAEKSRFAVSACLMLTIALTMCAMVRADGRRGTGCKAGPESLSTPSRTGDLSGALSCRSHRSTGDVTGQIMILTACMIAGFLLFILRFISYESADLPEQLMLGGSMDTVLEGTAAEVRSGSGMSRITLKDPRIILIEVDKETGEVTEQIIPLRHRVRVTFHKEANEIADPGNSTDTSYAADPADACAADPADPADVTGERLRVSGRLRRAPSADNPGCFDYRVYLRGRDTDFVMNANQISQVDDPGHHVTLHDRLRRRMNFARERFLAAFPDETIRGFIKGVVFGDKTDVDEEIRLDFELNATGHIMAVSGLHIGFLYSLLRLMSGKRKTKVLTVVIIAVLVMYGEMTMWSASTVRAVLVLSISMLTMYAGRPFDLLTGVSAAALMILIREPYQLFDTGFQMTFMALLGIAFLSKPLAALMGEALAVMISVQAGVLPVSAYVFHRINLISIFINIPVIAAASVLVPVCIVLLMIEILTGLIPPAGVSVISAVADLIIRMNDWFTLGGRLSNMVTSPEPAVVACLCMSLFLLASEWMRVRILRKEFKEAAAAFLSIILITAMLWAAGFNTFSDDEVVFVSVGQGDCTHIRAEGHDVLIDGGGSSYTNIGRKTLMPYLLSNRAERVELAIVTHLHMDHYLGITQLCEAYPVGAVGIPAGYRRSIEAAQDNSSFGRKTSPNLPDLSALSEGFENLPDEKIWLETGTRITIADDVWIEPIWPPPGQNGDISADDENENNMVYIVNYDGIKLMITGDLVEEDELEMVKYYAGTDILNCDVLKVGHHGSKTSSSEEFLDAVSPKVAVIQVGRDNFYGHPHPQTLERLEERGIQVYRTDLNGAVGIDIRKGTIFAIDLVK